MTPKPQPRNLAHIHRDRGYRFSDRDPILEFITNDITDSGLALGFIAERSGVSASTLSDWQSGKTLHPQNATVEAVLTALGWSRPIVPSPARSPASLRPCVLGPEPPSAKQQQRRRQ